MTTPASRPASTDQPFRAVGRAGDGPVVPLSGSPMSPEDIAAYVRERLESRLLAAEIGHGRCTLVVAPQTWRTVVRMAKLDPVLDCQMFDFLAGIDHREEGFAVLVSLYSVRHGHHVQVRALADGGREEPRMPSIADTYAGANWSERETYDMFGIVFEGHPGLEPRILTTEGFEGWPLRKEFLLTTREVKPWPGLKEPKDPEEEVVEDGERVPADSGPGAEEKARLAKEKAERAKRKAAEMRARKAAERAAARGDGEAAPTADGVAPEQSSPSDHADRTGAAVRSQAAGEVAGGPEGQPGQPSGTPGVEAEGRHGGAREQSGTRPASETPGMGTPPGTTGEPDRPGDGTPSGAQEGPAGPPAAGEPGEPPAGEADASSPPAGQEERAAGADDDDERQE